MLGNLSARLSWRADDAFELIASTWVTIAADAVSVPAAFLAVYLVRRISSGLPVTLASAHL
jgi:hypothetical protein